MGLNQHDLLLMLENVNFLTVQITEKRDKSKVTIGFSLKLSFNGKAHQLLTARGQERLFKNLNTVIRYIKGLPVKRKQILITLF